MRDEHVSLLLSCERVNPPPSVCVEPYILIMEYVSYGTLRTFLQTHRSHLSTDPELQSLLTIASYHVALAMQHLRSKMVTAKDFMHLLTPRFRTFTCPCRLCTATWL